MQSSRRNGNRQGHNGFRTAALLSVAAICLLALLCVLLAAGLRGGSGNPSETSGVFHHITAETPAPTAAPTVPPAPAFAFLENAENPLPASLERLALGAERTLDGTITCNYPLTSVTVMILCDYTENAFYPYIGRVTFAAGSNIKSYRFSDASGTREGKSLSGQLPLSALKTGLHTIVISASCTQTGMGGDTPFMLESAKFYVLGEDWTRITDDMFSNGSYKTALAFFGETERFLYRFQKVYGRYTVADPDWEAAYIAEIKMDEGEPWRVHTDALPYYERVRAYFGSARVRVHGTNGDTGVLPLSRLIVDYNGSYLSRYTSGLKYFSHHGLGTATDLNAVMPPNQNNKENLRVIEDEVQNCLIYNGILTENGAQYYDFTYSGSYACTDFGMPESVINYLLYELAFYRAGFQWGHYYNSTSDGMHFALTDNIRVSHDGGKRGLRKVYEYYD